MRRSSAAEAVEKGSRDLETQLHPISQALSWACRPRFPGMGVVPRASSFLASSADVYLLQSENFSRDAEAETDMADCNVLDVVSDGAREALGNGYLLGMRDTGALGWVQTETNGQTDATKFRSVRVKGQTAWDAMKMRVPYQSINFTHTCRLPFLRLVGHNVQLTRITNVFLSRVE